MARDRQRAKQRRRRAASNPGPHPKQLDRADLPGDLEHASGEVDEFEARLIAGANGEPALDEAAADEAEDVLEEEAEIGPAPAAEAEDEEQLAPAPRRGAPAPGAATHGRGGLRFVAFLRASWSELQRVQWPDRRQVFQATGVVLGFVLIAGAYLGVADWVAQRVVDFIL
jgi:preprotein translocase subunit SecE